MDELSVATKEIVDLIPIEQLKPEAAARINTKVHAILSKLCTEAAEERQNKITDLQRRLYIAEKAIEDEKLRMDDKKGL